MAIRCCQVDYIWNEPKSRIGGLTCDPDLEARRHKFLTWILRHRGHEKLRPRQGSTYLISLETEARRSLSSRSAWDKTSPRYRHGPIYLLSGPHLLLQAYIGTLEEGRFTLLCLLALTCQHICWNLLLQDFSLYRRTIETPSLVGLSNY